MAKRFGSFSYRIDYGKAIAEDERTIALCERAIAGRWFAVDGYDTLLTLIYRDATVAAELGLSAEDLDCVAAHLDYRGELEPYAVRGAEIPGFYRRGEAIANRLCGLVAHDFANIYSEAQWRDMLKRAKASLARHKRNQEKNGKGA